MKTLRSVQLLILLLISSFAIGQTDIPAEYGNEYQKQQEKYDQLKNDFDVVLDPIEQVPLEPSFYSIQNQGNWGYNYLKVSEFRNEISQRGQRKVAVFIFDTGGQYDHPALQKAQWLTHAKSFTGESSLLDGNGHSTHVAGIIGGVVDQYHVGLADMLVEKDLLKLIPTKVLSNSGSGQFSWIIGGITDRNKLAKQLIDQGWFVIYNFSLGAHTKNATLDAALKEAEDIGVFVTASAGNSGKEGVGTPANGNSAHAIASIQSNATRSNFSTYGPEVYGAAPGSRIFSTYKGGSYKELSGTSMAAPSEAAIVAIIASINPDATNRQISRFIAKYSTQLGKEDWNKFTGFGAPILDQLLAEDPTLELDEGNGNPGNENPSDPDEPVEEPTKDERTITLTDLGEFTVLWKPFNKTGGFYKAKVELTVEYETNLFGDTAFDKLQEATQNYFSNRGFGLRENDDFIDAGYWAGIHFYQMMLGREGFDVKVVECKVKDEDGRTAIAEKRSSVNAFFTKLFNPEIRGFSLN